MNGEDLLFITFPFIGVIAIIIGIAFLIGSAQDTKGLKTKTGGIRHVYMYLVSFVTLLIFTASLVSLVHIGLQSWVFTKAEPIGGNQPPPSLYLETELARPVDASKVELCADDACALTTSQREQIGYWQADYTQWENDRDVNRRRAQALINALSFLVIAGVVFFFHWRLARRDKQREDGSPLMVRAIYLWAFSFIWLITIIISGGFFINTIIKQIIPSAREVANTKDAPALVNSGNVAQLTECSDVCQLDGSVIALAEKWPIDYQSWNDDNRGESPFANNMVNTIPFLLVSIPLFWYHFRKVRNENKHTPEQKDQVEN